MRAAYRQPATSRASIIPVAFAVTLSVGLLGPMTETAAGDVGAAVATTLAAGLPVAAETAADDAELAAILDECATLLAGGRLEEAGALIARASARGGRVATFRGLVERLAARGLGEQAMALALGTASAWLREGAPEEAAELLAAVAPPATGSSPTSTSEGSSATESLTPGAATDATTRLHALLGEALVKSERHPSAIPHLERALDRGWSELEARFYLAAAYWEVGRYDDAETLYRGGLTASGDAFPWRHQLGRLLLWQGRDAEAATLLAAAAGQRPAAADVRLDLAWALDRSGREDDAVAAYRAAIERAPELAKAHYGLAQLLRRRGDVDAARAHLETFQRLYREGRERARREGLERARLEQGEDLLRRGRHEEAATHFRALGDGVAALRGLARAQRALGDLPAAVATLERAVTLAPDDPTLRRELAAARLAAPPSR